MLDGQLSYLNQAMDLTTWNSLFLSFSGFLWNQDLRMGICLRRMKGWGTVAWHFIAD